MLQRLSSFGVDLQGIATALSSLKSDTKSTLGRITSLESEMDAVANSSRFTHQHVAALEESLAFMHSGMNSLHESISSNATIVRRDVGTLSGEMRHITDAVTHLGVEFAPIRMLATHILSQSSTYLPGSSAQNHVRSSDPSTAFDLKTFAALIMRSDDRQIAITGAALAVAVSLDIFPRNIRAMVSLGAFFTFISLFLQKKWTIPPRVNNVVLLVDLLGNEVSLSLDFCVSQDVSRIVFSAILKGHIVSLGFSQGIACLIQRQERRSTRPCSPI
jgi:hypothetical protein